jgi:hypothetical protein
MMAHFAKVANNSVLDVIVINNEDCGGGVFPESESLGKAFISSIGLDGDWLQTSYTGSFRGKYAGIGDTYDPDLDEFVAPEPAETD